MTRRYAEDQVAGLHRYLAYVSPGSVQYWPEDIALLIPYLLQMREGVGPVDPRPAKDAGIRGSGRHGSRNEAWCQVAAEIDTRAAHCHEDRFILEAYVKWLDELTAAPTEDKEQQAIEQIAKGIHRDPAKVRRDLNSVLSFIASGPCARWQACLDCAEYGRCSKKKHPPKKMRDNPRGTTYEEWKGHRRKGK
jgi:hypothetical protein